LSHLTSSKSRFNASTHKLAIRKCILFAAYQVYVWPLLITSLLLLWQ
jgi:hypothetical protein